MFMLVRNEDVHEFTLVSMVMVLKYSVLADVNASKNKAGRRYL